MKNKYPEYRLLDLPKIEKEILSFWEKNNVFDKTKKTKKILLSFTKVLLLPMGPQEYIM